MPATRFRHAPVRKQQIRDIRAGARGLVAHWHIPVLTPVPMRERPLSTAAKRNIRQLLRHGKKHGAKYFNAAIMRMGFVPRTKRSKADRQAERPVRIEYPTAETHYMDSFGGRHQRATLWEIKQFKKVLCCITRKNCVFFVRKS